MLSRLSGLANTVLQELSGDGADGEAETSAPVPVLESAMESRDETPEDMLERLAHTERLVVQLKDLIREKDAQLQQKEVVLKEEREAADAKLMKLKLQAKAKLAALNKHVEELTGQGASLPVKSPPGEQLDPSKNDQRTNEEHREEAEALKQQLQEQEETLRDLREQLAAARESQKDMQANQAAQLSSLQEVIREKDALLEEEARRHQAELLQAAARPDLEGEMQQHLKTLQRKLEEQEEALLGRAQVVDFLQQELRGAEQQSQTLSEQCQKMEAELSALQSVLEAEREASRSLPEKMELELAEQKQALHSLQEEVQSLSEQLAQAGRARAELESECRALEQKHRLETEEKDLQICRLQMVEQELCSSHDALVAENQQLRQDVDRLLAPPAECSAAAWCLQEELAQTSEASIHPQADPALLNSLPVAQVFEEQVPALKPGSAQAEATLQEHLMEQQEETGILLPSTAALEDLKAENETLRARLALVEAQLEAAMGTEHPNQADSPGADALSPESPSPEEPSSAGDPSPGPEGASVVPESREEPSPQLPDDPAPPPQAGTEDASTCSSQLAGAGGSPATQGSVAAEEHKELSVLLLELSEAQEEIDFLKRQQLQDPGSQTSMGTWTGEETSLLGEGSQVEFLTGEGQEASPPQNELSGSSMLTEVEAQGIAEHREQTSIPESIIQGGGEMGAVLEVSGAAPEPGTCQPQELTRLQMQIEDLQARLRSSEELHENELREKAAEISRLNQLVEEHRRNVEDSSSALCALAGERDQLLSQMTELCTITELKEQVRQLEENLADSEKQRFSDYESRTVQFSLLKEQIQSLKNESKSKEVKIEALQKDLDEAQLELSQQDAVAKGLKSQLERKEGEVLDREERLRKSTVKTEELSQNITAKELETARLEELLAEQTETVASLQRTLQERDQQMMEISVSMSEKMVLLNEEKFSLGSELKSLKEQMSQRQQTPEVRDQQTETVGEAEDTRLVGDGPQRQGEAAPRREEEVPVGELELLRRENEQVKRKLQVALVNRKELLKKVSRLESDLACGREQPGAEAPEAAAEENAPSGPRSGTEGTPESPGKETVPAEREAELQSLRDALLEKEAAEARSQAQIEEMRQSLQDKATLVESLRAEVTESQSALQKLTAARESSEARFPADEGDSKSEDVGASAAGLEEQETSALRARISALEQEREQLHRKLQEALASRKDTIKKAQEKDRHHREQLKQQKDDYNLLQEQFDKQSKEKESIQDELRQLQEQRASAERPLSAPVSSCSMQSSSLEAENTQASGSLRQDADISAEEPGAELAALQAERDQLRGEISRVETELADKSQAAVQLQERIAQLLSEVAGLQRACQQAEAKAASLQLELERSHAEISGQEDVEELKGLVRQKEEEIGLLHAQLGEKSEALASAQAERQEKDDVIQALSSQLDGQARAHEEQSRRLQAELLEVQQKQDEGAEEAKWKSQMQRKLQAALISRKEALKESKSLKEELAAARATAEDLSIRLRDLERQASDWAAEKDALSAKVARLTEEREKLIAEVDKALMENQNLDSSCESLKLALEGITRERETLEKEVESARSSQAATSSEWREKHQELQKEYETLLQSYENVSNEAERIQRVLETVRQEKQEVFLRLKGAEGQQREAEKQLQDTEREVEGMKEKMRKFAKSKQQKILELEEENERLRAEVHPADGDPGRAGDAAPMSAGLSEELERARQEHQSLSAQLEMLMAEKAALSQEVQDLKHQMQCAESKLKESLKAAEVEESRVVPAAASPLARAEDLKDVSSPPETLVPATAGPVAEAERKEREGSASPSDIGAHLQQIAQLAERISDLEEGRTAAEEELGRVRASVETLEQEKAALESLVAAKVQDLNSLQETVAQMELTGRQTKEELARMTQLKEATEAEKDDLEERLMNQLAELNGSIGNYQQDVTDLQARDEQLRSELQGLQRAMHELEEEKRQLLREKAEAEAETRREHAEKLQCARKGDGSRTHAKELQELLKQKQQEVRQLQKDCIRSQEKVSGLERTVKALEFVHSESQKELEAAKESVARAGEDAEKARAELASCRARLDDTQSEAARVLAESLRVKEELQATRDQVQAQAKKQGEDFEKRLVQERDKHAKEVENMAEKLAASHRERDRLEGAVGDVQDSLHKKDQETKQLQGSLNKTLAQLAAFTRSMSSLQDDRDRVIDESRTWERKFTKAIQKKEEEIRSKEETCAVLKDQVRQMTMHAEELQIQISRLEHDKRDWEAESKREAQQHREASEKLQEENKGLLSQLEEAQRLHRDSQSEQQKLEGEIKSLRDQLANTRHSFAKCESTREELESTVRQQEASLQDCRFSCEQLEADLQASRDLTNKLQEEIGAKDQKILSLLSAKEEAVVAAVSEFQQQHTEEIKELESNLSKKEEEKTALENGRKKALDKLDRLAEKMKVVREESRQKKAQLDSFTKSMSSLQDDRDRVLREYRQLEERHLAVILEKDQLIQEAATENNTLKEEIRSFHSRMDDLHSENAKLEAELVRYREDLNQVISIKDSQQKQLLKTQLQRIQALEKDKASAEEQLKEADRALEALREQVEALQKDKVGLSEEMETLTASLSEARDEVAALREGAAVVDLEARLKGREDEVQELSSRLTLTQQRLTEVEEDLDRVQREAAKKVDETEHKLRKELKHLHHDAGVMRNETETAEERVAELARDLMEMEQKLLAVTEENKDLRAQIQSFGKSMSSLQDSWDQSNEELRALQQKYAADMEEQQGLVHSLQKERAQLQEGQSSLARERDSLVSELAALKEAADERGLLSQVEKLHQQLRAKEEELRRVSSELDGASSQVKSFSKAMASLQGERDRILSELDKARKVEEAKQQAAVSTSASPAEVQSLKKALSSLQADRDRLVTELKNLQQQYLQVGVDTAEISRLRTQLQEQQQEAEELRRVQEQLQQEGVSWQQELQQLRQEKATWEEQSRGVKEQCLMAIADKDQQLSHLQRIVQELRPPLSQSQVVEEQHQGQASTEPPGTRDASNLEAETKHLRAQLGDSLKELHHKELRIQQLHSKLSPLFEEKNTLSLQLRGSSRSLRESHQHYSEVLARCATLEKQLRDLQPPSKDVGSLMTDAAPGAPQEKSAPPRECYTPELQELQLRLSEAEHLRSSTKQDLRQAEEQLQEERDRRLAVEDALCAAQDQIRRLESGEWASTLSHGIDMSPAHEHALLLDPAEGSFSKTRGNSGRRRLLRSLFCSRARLPLLVAAYLLALHVLLLLCFTGHL
ncbi:golgin subfamily B member 1 isoform X1 [Alligator sinensis]|uniref:Golgin subfamily B member 1 isoform X1 n=1 Tax=Alligator sinensis TaxID=38654 RepID=A0A1U7SMU6_ALLSI|nr:golgin subfamily B member 1 isoform X1 [Alligator sinensis]